MSTPRETDLSAIKTHYGLALDEIRVKRAMDVIKAQLCGLQDHGQLLFLQNEMHHLRRKLVALKALRS